MGYYIFALTDIHVKHRRGNIPDDDVITFTILVNQLDLGHGSAVFPSMSASADGVPAKAVPPNNRLNMDMNWWVGPLEILPEDEVHVVYSGFNISDRQLTSLATEDQDKIELRILNAVAAAGVAAIGGLGGVVTEAIAAAVSQIGDPVGTLIGYSPQGPCNGQVFSDAVSFNGGGIEGLPFAVDNGRPSISFTRTYSDEATHDTAKCGRTAETDITFSIYQLPSSVSVKALMTLRGVPQGIGLRELCDKRASTSLKAGLGLRA